MSVRHGGAAPGHRTGPGLSARREDERGPAVWLGQEPGASRASTLVRITRSYGACGWGECWGTPAASTAMVHSIADDVVGRRLDTLANIALVQLERNYHTSLGGRARGCA